MKKILILVIACLPVFGIGQRKELIKNPNYKKQNIEGLGSLKINKTTLAVIDSFSKLAGVKYDDTEYTLGDIPFNNTESTSLDIIYELKKDSTFSEKEYDSHSIYAKEARVFYLNYFKAGNIGVKNIYLSFYNDTLVKINIGLQGLNDKVNDAFSTKYGPSESILTITKPVVCQNGYGAIFNYEEKYTNLTWTSSVGNIKAIKSSYIFYSNCKKEYSFDFYIEDSKLMALVTKEEKANIEKYNSKNKLTKKDLEDF